MPAKQAAVAAAAATLALAATVAASIGAASPTTVSWRFGALQRAQPLVAPESPTPTAAPRMAVPRLAAPDDAESVSADAHLFGWALLDRHTGAIAGSANRDSVHNTVESMIKPWIAADYVRRLAEHGERPTEQELDELTMMIIDSNDPMAEKYYRMGGSDDVVRRMISTCDLDQVRIKAGLWSWTEMTPLDSVRFGDCLADGRAAGPQWTLWLLDTMRAVRGGVADQRSGSIQGGRWGIIDALPPELATATSIKNGWTSYWDGWHVNCLAVHEEWSLAIMIRSTRGLAAAAEICREVTEQLVVDPAPGQPGGGKSLDATM